MGQALLKVKDAMVTDLVVVDEDVSVKEAVERMNDFEIGCLHVMSGEKVFGILTERDILKRVVAEGRKPEETLVRDVMSKPLVVVKEDKLVGLVTFTDIARFQPVIAKYAERLATGQALPRRMEKVIRYYIA